MVLPQGGPRDAAVNFNTYRSYSDIARFSAFTGIWPHPYSTSILGYSSWIRSPMLGSIRAGTLRVKLFSKYSNLCEIHTCTWTSLTDRRTDRQTGDYSRRFQTSKKQYGTRFTRRDRRLSSPRWPFIYRDFLPVRRRSLFQVLRETLLSGLFASDENLWTTVELNRISRRWL